MRRRRYRAPGKRPVSTDAERQHGGRGGGKARRPPQQSERESQILREPVEPRPSPLIARLFSQPQDIPEGRPGPSLQLQVRRHLVAQLSFVPRAVQQVPEPPPCFFHVSPL